MGAGTSSGIGANSQSTTGNAQAQPMTQQLFSSSVSSYGGRALTTNDIKEFANTLKQGAKNGDVIVAVESNGYYTIEDRYVRKGGAWMYTRTNISDGLVYDKQIAFDDDVASAVLSNAHSNDPWNWRYQRT